jgi:hypothetical protein
MTTKEKSSSKPSADSIQKTRRTVGAVAIALIAVLFVLLFIGLNFYVWLILVALIWLVANFALRGLKRKQLEL